MATFGIVRLSTVPNLVAYDVRACGENSVSKAMRFDFLEDVMKKYVRAYLTEPLERIAAIRLGVEQAELVALAADLNISIRTLRKDLRVPREPLIYSIFLEFASVTL